MDGWMIKWMEHDKRSDGGFFCMWAVAGLPFEHGSKFGVILQFISHPN